jgi:RNA polymerase sigma-70 factor (ECF subfamily)
VAIGVEEPAGPDPGDAFAALYAEVYRPLVGYCRQLTQHADPEDLAQEALLRAWLAWPRYADRREMWPLVVTIARRLSIDEFRKSQRGVGRTRAEAADRQPAAPGPEEALELREQAVQARRALTQLSPRYQRLLTMRDLEERSYIDIARHEGTTLEVARSTMRRARAALRAAYQRAGEGVAAAFGLRAWAGRRLSRVQGAIGPTAHQGLATLAGAAVAIAVAVGLPAAPRASTVQTTSSGAARILDTALPGGVPRGTAVKVGTGAAGTPAHTGASTPVVSAEGHLSAPDHVVGPVGVGGEGYRKRRTKNAEVQIEVHGADTVLVGVYANPSVLFTDPARPLRDDH